MCVLAHGGETAVKWDGLDGLTAKVDKGELIIDTKVLEADYLKRKKELEQEGQRQDRQAHSGQMLGPRGPLDTERKAAAVRPCG